MLLMARPFRGYRELAGGLTPDVVTGILRLSFVLGAFVSLTATGRFAPFELVSGMVSFAWIPLAHGVGLGVAHRAFAKDVPFRKAYALFLEGLGPWLLVLVGLAGLCLFTPTPSRYVFAALPWMLGIATVYGAVLLYALFRAGLALGRARALGATATFYIFMLLVVLGYYFAAGQLWPILPW
jgi:hypothetical protein